MRTFTHLPVNEIEGRINELLERYDLKNVADAKPESLPLGVKQRLQLAVAVLHRPRCSFSTSQPRVSIRSPATRSGAR